MSEEQPKEPSVEQVVEQPKEESPPIITSKQKNPKNVAAGKLGAISKAEKRKHMQRLMEEQQHSFSRYVIVAVGVSVLATAAYKFLFPKKEEPPHEKVHVEESPEKKKKIQRGKPISMFD